jgi:hypothetical protein
MTSIEITVPPIAAERGSIIERVTLSGREYILRLQWNVREERWTLSIADQSDVPILDGAVLVADWPLLRTVVDKRRPPGEIIAWDTTNMGRDPGLGDLGTRVLLAYIEP